MWRPNPCKRRTVHAWILEALDYLGKDGIHNPSPNLVMKVIHKLHGGVLFSPHWFSATYKKFRAQMCPA